MAERPHSPIYIVEDNAETREVLEHVLAFDGYATVSAEDAPEALRGLRDGLRPCLIILDLHLPGMDGQSFLREIKTDVALSGIPVVAFSGDGDGISDVAGFVRKGTDDPDVLLDLVEKVCLKD